MRLAIDIDGTIADIHTKWLSLYNRDFNDRLAISDWDDWDILKIIKPECGERFFKYVDDPDFYTGESAVLPIFGALETVEKLREKHQVIFVTSCSSGGMICSKLKWMFKFGFLKEPEYKSIKDFIVCHDKSFIKADWIIDDRPENLKSFYGKVLFDRPWNRKGWDPDCIRAIDWFTVKNIIDTFEN